MNLTQPVIIPTENLITSHYQEIFYIILAITIFNCVILLVMCKIMSIILNKIEENNNV